MDAANNTFLRVYHALINHYGEQGWWPAEHDFEVMVGAILTQNTSWSNVEKAILELKKNDLCNPQALLDISPQRLASIIRPSGYYNQKAHRLIGFSRWFLQQGGFHGLQQKSLPELRSMLLGVKGIGDETADDMLLYAFQKPSFVIDSYTRRIFSRLGLVSQKESYRLLQRQFQHTLARDLALYQQYHALIVAHAKKHCMKKPDCNLCPLIHYCEFDDVLEKK